MELLVLTRHCLDHHPLRLKTTVQVPHAPWPFRFQDMWLQHDSFMKTVSDNWSLPMLQPNSVSMLIRKLRRLKACLRHWNNDVFHNINDEIEQATQKLNEIQQIIAISGDSDANFEIEMNCLSHLNDLLSRRHALLTQKNRLQWLKYGDRNSAFFSQTSRLPKITTFHHLYTGW